MTCLSWDLLSTKMKSDQYTTINSVFLNELWLNRSLKLTLHTPTQQFLPQNANSRSSPKSRRRRVSVSQRVNDAPNLFVFISSEFFKLSRVSATMSLLIHGQGRRRQCCNVAMLMLTLIELRLSVFVCCWTTFDSDVLSCVWVRG